MEKETHLSHSTHLILKVFFICKVYGWRHMEVTKALEYFQIVGHSFDPEQLICLMPKIHISLVWRIIFIKNSGQYLLITSLTLQVNLVFIKAGHIFTDEWVWAWNFQHSLKKDSFLEVWAMKTLTLKVLPFRSGLGDTGTSLFSFFE